MAVTNIVTALKDGKVQQYAGVKEIVYPTRPRQRLSIPHVIPSHLPWEDDLTCTLVFLSGKEVVVDKVIDCTQYRWD